MDLMQNRNSLVPIVLGMFVLFPFLAKPYILIALFIFQFLQKWGHYHFKFRKEYLWILSIVIANIMGLIFTQNFHYAGKYFLRLLPFVLLIPLLANEKIDDDFIQKFSKTWIFSVLIYAVAYILYLVYSIQFTPIKDFNGALSVASRKMFGFNEHPIYTSIYIGITIIMLWKQKSSVGKYFKITILFMVLLILARKGPILYLGMTLIIMLIVYQRFSKKWMVYIGLGALVLALTYPFWAERFYEIFQANYDTSTGIRLIIWESTFNLLRNSYFMGYGTGDAKMVLNEYLETYTFVVPYPYAYNMHNQYLEIAMKSGVLGLFVFLWGAYHILKKTYKNYLTGFLIIVFLYLNMLTESLLERQNGLLIYGIFITISLFYTNKKT